MLPGVAAYYGTDSWNRVVTDIQSCAPVQAGTTSAVWLGYTSYRDTYLTSGDKAVLAVSPFIY